MNVVKNLYKHSLSRTNNYRREEVFRQVGTIINEYVPELYESDIFDPKQILSIDSNEKHDTTRFLKYSNIKLYI